MSYLLLLIIIYGQFMKGMCDSKLALDILSVSACSIIIIIIIIIIIMVY